MTTGRVGGITGPPLSVGVGVGVAVGLGVAVGVGVLVGVGVGVLLEPDDAVFEKYCS